MPETQGSKREGLRKNLPMDVVEPLCELLIQKFFDKDQEAVNTLVSAFFSEVGLSNQVELNVVLHERELGSMFKIHLSMTHAGKNYEKIMRGGCYYPDKPEFADDSHRGALLLNEIWWSIRSFTDEVYMDTLYKDIKTYHLYDDALFKAACVPVFDYSLEAEEEEF